jgi:hypothetical protein
VAAPVACGGWRRQGSLLHLIAVTWESRLPVRIVARPGTSGCDFYHLLAHHENSAAVIGITSLRLRDVLKSLLSACFLSVETWLPIRHTGAVVSASASTNTSNPPSRLPQTRQMTSTPKRHRSRWGRVLLRRSIESCFAAEPTSTAQCVASLRPTENSESPNQC